ncbi:MAG: S1 RNA-binding domain-containing protein, partial [Dehalococcoidia bacterium]|nr:S1 RNA-binding domain-containing protein [Dehalococcoidia bacterium]
DGCGDMDFKVAGTAQGITALQLDVKVQGIDFDILGEALDRAGQARVEILSKMAQTISSSRPELSPCAPRMHEMRIDASKIGSVIGPGGRTIRSIIQESKTNIEVKDDGTVIITSPSEEATQKAVRRIEDLTREVKAEEIYTGKVTRILNFGAMVEILPGKEGLVHISELEDYRVATVEDVVKVGDEVTVKVIEIDNMGRVNLSRKAVFEKTPRAPGASARSRDASSSERPLDRRPYRGHVRPQARRSGPYRNPSGN